MVSDSAIGNLKGLIGKRREDEGGRRTEGRGAVGSARSNETVEIVGHGRPSSPARGGVKASDWWKAAAYLRN